MQDGRHAGGPQALHFLTVRKGNPQNTATYITGMHN